MDECFYQKDELVAKFELEHRDYQMEKQIQFLSNELETIKTDMLSGEEILKRMEDMMDSQSQIIEDQNTQLI